VESQNACIVPVADNGFDRKIEVGEGLTKIRGQTRKAGTVPAFLTTFRQPLTIWGRKGWIGDCRVMIADF
jgi:hypothetical protein